MRRSTSRRFIVPGILAALAGGVMLAGCTTKKAQSAPPVPAVPVTVAPVVAKTVPVQLRAIGRVETLSTVQLKSQVNGEITAVHFKDGQFVKKGDLLFSIDRRTFEASLHQAEANLARDIAQAENARIQARRYEQLAEQGVAAKQVSDQMTTTAEAYDASVKADRAAVEYAKLQLQYCSIYSPMDGRTGALQVYPGAIVKANDVPVLVVINQISPIYVEFSVPEQNLSALKQYMAAGRLKVEAVIPNDPRTAHGILTFVDNTVDRTTGTIRLRGTFSNEDTRLWPGQFVDVVLTLTEEPNVTVVPSQAVQTGQAGQFVFIAKQDQTAEMRPVTVVRTVDGNTVISKGVQPGESVVTDGQLRLAPGSKITIKSGS